MKTAVRWSRDDEKRLRFLWDEPMRIHEIARRLNRTVSAIYIHATRRLGLVGGLPDGCVHLTAAARRCGMDRNVLLNALRWAGVPIRFPRSRPTKSNLFRQSIVDLDDVEHAVAEWCKTETPELAAQRYGCSSHKVRRALLAAGHKHPGRNRPWRLLPETIDQAMTNYKKENAC